MKPITDEPRQHPVTTTDTLVDGPKWGYRRDQVDLGIAGEVTRDYLVHPGAVSVVVLDDNDCVLLQQQYRHPVRQMLWEIPAGLLDVPGESPHLAAARELREEADLEATDWAVLADYYNSPGSSDEAVRVFLARQISEVPHSQRHTRVAEEATMTHRWVPLNDALNAVLTGRIQNPSAVIGVLAAHHGAHNGWSTLRPADTPWPGHKNYSVTQADPQH